MPCSKCDHCHREERRRAEENGAWGLASDALDIVCRSHGFLRSDLRKKGRGDARHSFARQVACYLIRETSALSFPAIGSLLNLDHSTVIYAHHHVTRRMQLPAFAARIAQMKAEILAGQKKVAA